MKELVKVRVAGTELALTTEAFETLEDYLAQSEHAHRAGIEGALSPEEVESRIVAHLLERQPSELAVEKEHIDSAIVSVGYAEGYPKPELNKVRTRPTAATTTPPQANTTQLGPVGGFIVACAKVIGWVLGICWIIATFGVVIGFITLLIAGVFDTTYLTGYDGFASPVLFAGLLCAVIALGMGILGDLWFKLLRGKRVNVKMLLVSAMVWLFFSIWLAFACVHNAEGWTRWSYEAEQRIEQWEEDVEEWAEDFEAQMLGLEEQMKALEATLESDGFGTQEWNSTTSVTLNGGLDTAKLEYLCDKYDELDEFEDELEHELLRGRQVVINFSLTKKDGLLTRTTEIVTEGGTDTITKVCASSQTTIVIN